MNEVWDAVLREDIGLIEQYAANENDLEVGARLRGTTLLYEALTNEKYRSYKRLLELGASPNTICRGGALPIQCAAGMDDPKWLKLALQHGGDPNVLNTSGEYGAKTPPIFAAVLHGHVENAILLVESGADVNAKDEVGNPIICFASECGRFCAVKKMLEFGADAEASRDGKPVFLDFLKDSIPRFVGEDAEREANCYLAVRDLLVDEKLIAAEELPSVAEMVIDKTLRRPNPPVNEK